MLYVRLSTLALLAGSVSGFAPPASLAGQWATTLNLASAASPEVFLQSRIAEPADVESVGAAAYALSDKFPTEPFVVQYRDRDIEDYYIEKKPVLDMTVLKQIKIDDKKVTVEAGTTIESLADAISKGGSPDLKELFYSLPAAGGLSVAECVLDPRCKKFHKAISEVKVLDKHGKTKSKQRSDVDVKEDIIVSVDLFPPSRESSELVARWYSWKIDDMLTLKSPDLHDWDLSDDVKVIIHKYGYLNNIPNIVVFVDGGRDLGLPKDQWNEVLVKTPQELWYLQNDLSAKGGFDKLTASGILDTSKVNPSSDEILSLFAQRSENLLVWIENKGQIRASFDVLYPPDVDDAVREHFVFNKEVPMMRAMSAEEKPALFKSFSKPRGLDTIITTPGIKIPGFGGEIYDGVRGQMQNKRFQYATSSYDNMMNPSLIVYPRNETDVSIAIKYAANPGISDSNPSGSPFKVMGRGGGHQYCGVSCDNDALIISMDLFNKLEHKDVELKGITGPDGEKHDVTKELRVGTGIKLKEFAVWNNKNGWTIPHGECPTVGIGGHSQSGGYGHNARAFGLAIDYIYGFTIVLADGEIRTVDRDSKKQEDLDLYWAVMGGSPGAFGVTTELIIHPILDKDYPNSTAFAKAFDYSKGAMLDTLKIVEDFINRANADHDNAICEELDLMVSLSSNNGNRLLSWLDQEKDSITPNQNIILFELECRDQTNIKAREQMNDIIEDFNKMVSDINFLGKQKMNFLSPKKYDGKTYLPLSEMSLQFTRKPPGVTAGTIGRENRKPYRKMCYGSNDKVTEGWAESFAKLLDDTVNTKNDISCVFQVVVGGGKQASLGKAELNSIAHRDAQLHGIVYDLFRGADEKSIKEADMLSKRFELDVVDKHQTQYPKVMAQWASHGDLDMNKRKVWEKYYDKEETYRKLRRIKKVVDPEDRFHSRFTVRPED
jgi:FAD/FMN-containing dehydrogenase